MNSIMASAVFQVTDLNSFCDKRKVTSSQMPTGFETEFGLLTKKSWIEDQERNGL